jgi:hypothetical protein
MTLHLDLAASAFREPDPSAPPALGAPRVDRVALVALEVERLRRVGWARAAAALGAVLAVGFGAAVLLARADGGAATSFAGVLRTAARAIAWGVGAPLALAAARDRAGLELAEGIEAMVAARGVSRALLGSARHAAAMALGARLLGAPVLVVGVVAVAASGTARSALAHAGAALAALLFAAVAGVTLGGVGAVCARVGGRRSGSVLAFVVLAPWLAADLVGRAAYSIPGALDALLSMLMSAAGASGGAT